MLQFQKKSSYDDLRWRRTCVNRTRRHYHILERVVSGREKREACLEGLKHLNKELLAVLSNELKLFQSCFYRKRVVDMF